MGLIDTIKAEAIAAIAVVAGGVDRVDVIVDSELGVGQAAAYTSVAKALLLNALKSGLPVDAAKAKTNAAISALAAKAVAALPAASPIAELVEPALTAKLDSELDAAYAAITAELSGGEQKQAGQESTIKATVVDVTGQADPNAAASQAG